jgi:hypothetical protein
MSRASSEPQDGSHVLVEGLVCAYHRAPGPGVGAGAEVDVGGEYRRECSSPGQSRGQGGPVGHASYSRSMLSMQARASVCCWGVADVFCNVVGEEGWWRWKLLSGAGAHNIAATLPSFDHHCARIDLLYMRRSWEGAATHQVAFGMVGARSSYCSLPKATLSASIRRM